MMKNIVYFIEISESIDPQQNILIDFVSEEKKRKLSKYRFNIDMKLSLYAELLIRCQICKLLLISNKEIIFDKTNSGKPYLHVHLNFYFNISHTRTAIVVALSDQEIGVDIEKIKQANLAISNKFFTELEQKYIFDSYDKDKAFYEIWTRKEAYLKYIGNGLKMPLTSFDVQQSKIKSKITTFQLNNYLISVCLEKNGTKFDVLKLFESQIVDMALTTLK